MEDRAVPVRVFISYAHDSAEHIERVREFWVFLRSVGIDARLDLSAAEQPQDWPVWMQEQIELARFVLVIASPAYRKRADGKAGPSEGRGVQWEAALLRDLAYADRRAAVARVLSVVLPGCSYDGIPTWLGPASHSRYEVSAYTVEARSGCCGI